MDSIIPKSNRLRHWHSLTEDLGLKLPSLCIPTYLSTILLLAFLFMLIISLFGGCFGITNPSFRWSCGLCAIVFAITSYGISSLFASRIPNQCYTVADTSNYVLSEYFAGKLRNRDLLNNQDVWYLVQDIVSKQFGIEHHKITVNLRFVEDIGMG